MNKLVRLISGILLVFILVQCEEIIPKPPPGSGGNNGNGGDPTGLVPVEGEYANCLNVLADTTLDVVTWNIEQFSESNTVISRLQGMIETMNADIIGLQEISSISDLNNMVNDIDGWEAAIIEQGGLSTGYLYKSSEVSLEGSLSLIYEGDNYAFPRAPIIGNFRHVSGLSVTIINLHLKCCGSNNDELRRRDASEKLKTYIDNNQANDRVIVLGDYNDEIQDLPAVNVFQNFINDEQNYLFTDMETALGSSADFSYPSWPSHLDHILITNELFDDWEYTRTIKFDDCYSSYEVNISDHRPVLARFNTN